MTEEEIKKKAEDWYKNIVKINEWNEKGVCTTYMPNATTGFIAGAKLMQKENTELKEENAELTEENEHQKNLLQVMNDNDEQLRQTIKELKAQIEKLLDFVVERTVCCDVCPSSDTCRNDEGTCPHAGLLKENEEKVTREWILKSITKE